MKVSSNLHAASNPNLYRDQQQTALRTGVVSSLPRVDCDLLEISPEGRQLNLIHKEAVKVTIPQSPKDDVSEMMKMFRPETYERMKGYLDQGDIEEGLGLLLSFTKEIAKHPAWLRAYREAAQK